MSVVWQVKPFLFMHARQTNAPKLKLHPLQEQARDFCQPALPDADFFSAHFVSAVHTLASAFDSLVDMTGFPCPPTNALPVMAFNATFEPAVLDAAFAHLEALIALSIDAQRHHWHRQAIHLLLLVKHLPVLGLLALQSREGECELLCLLVHT